MNLKCALGITIFLLFYVILVTLVSITSGVVQALLGSVLFIVTFVATMFIGISLFG